MTNDLRRRQIVQLDIWPDKVRGGPNALLRSAFFAGIASKKRKVLGIQEKVEREPEGITIIAQDGIKIKYAGTQLNQYDADVFFEALHLARRHPLETECLFTGASFLRAIGRTRNDLNYEDLDQSLRRLNRGTVDIEFKAHGRPYVFTGHLVSNYTRDTESKLYKITFANEIKTLFAPHSWTQLEAHERRVLKGSPLAQWLHSFFSTHASAYPVGVEYLHRMSGSPTVKLYHFKTELRNAMDRIHDEIGWVFTWDGDVVRVTRTPSGSQIKHLSRKSAKAKSTRVERVIEQHRPESTKTLPKPRGGDAASRNTISDKALPKPRGGDPALIADIFLDLFSGKQKQR